MDPNATLTEIRFICNCALTAIVDESDFQRLAELLEALDAWIVGGGFLPDDWSQDA